MEILLHVWFKDGLVFCFPKAELCCVCFRPFYLFVDGCNIICSEI